MAKATDVIIIGGGPAGATLGSYLSRAGIKNIILDKALHPRPHVGESLVTATTRVFNDIDFLQTMEDEGFIHKYGASWHPTEKIGEFAIEFREFPQEGIDQDYTYHVDRSKFDMLLLQHAAKQGSTVCEGVGVKKVLFENGQATGVLASIGAREFPLEARLVVDASGRDTLLGRQLNLKKKDPIFDQYAVHAWYEGVNRSTCGTEDFIHIYFLKAQRGWAWQIPITEEITSMGVVLEKEVFKNSKDGVENYFQSHVNSNPNLAQAMNGARRINEFKREGDYSYSMSKFCGDGWLLLGDAARFVDPIFSSGVSVAIYSARFAQHCIRNAFEMGNFNEAAFAPYATKLRGGVNVWYDFIKVYYKLLPLFTHFIQSDEHRLGLLQLLQGDVYDRTEVPVLDAMKETVRKVEAAESHLWKRHLTDIPID